MKPYFKSIIKPNSTIIDIGAGDLYISKLMQDELKCKVTGVDVIDYGTDYVKKIITKGNKLPFEDNSFDYAIFSCVVHHISKEKQEEILNEAKRVAKTLLLFEDAPKFMSYFLDIVTNRMIMPKGFGHRSVISWNILFSNLKLDCVFYDIDKPLLYPIKHYLFELK